MSDARPGLKPDTAFIVNGFTYQINNEIGRGGSCIVYRGLRIQDDPINLNEVIIKEFFPKVFENLIARADDGVFTIPDEIRDDFQERKRHFITGQGRHNWLYSQNQDNVLSQAILVNDRLFGVP